MKSNRIYLSKTIDNKLVKFRGNVEYHHSIGWNFPSPSIEVEGKKVTDPIARKHYLARISSDDIKNKLKKPIIKK